MSELETTATCNRCGESKALRAFGRDASRANGHYPWCKLCRKKYSPGAQQDAEGDLNGHECPLCDTPIRGHANRRFCSQYCKDRVASLRKRFGVSVEQYRAMVAATGGRCPICKCRPKKWALDHDHETGWVMGVVCTGCNVGILAHSRHDPLRVRRTLDYLLMPPAMQLGEGFPVITFVPDDPSGSLRGKSKVHQMWGKRA